MAFRMPLIGSVRSASGVVEDGERGLNEGIVVGCLTAAVGDGGGPKIIDPFFQRIQSNWKRNLLEMVWILEICDLIDLLLEFFHLCLNLEHHSMRSN